MTQMRYDKDANLSIIQGKKVAIIGYGSQGHAHSLNLKESGVNVRIGLKEGSPSRAKAEEAGLEVKSVSEATQEADAIVMLAPDPLQPTIYATHIKNNLKPGDLLLFAHGFNIRYDTIKPPDYIDVAMVAPKSPGHRVRETYREGGGVPALLAVHQDATGQADATAMSYAAAIGCARAGILTTTFTEETETDLFGEQVVLCGGVSSLVKAAFSILVEAGYQPELAYFECFHELKLIVDLMYRGGLNYMRYSVSNTAEWGDYVSGPRVINDDVQTSMKQLLSEIQDGTFAKRWIEENENGAPRFKQLRHSEHEQMLEQIGTQLRSMMPFVDPVEIKQET